MNPTPLPSYPPVQFPDPDIRFGYYVWPPLLALFLLLAAAGLAYATYRASRGYYVERRIVIATALGAGLCFAGSIFFAIRAYRRIDQATAVIGGVGGLLLLVLLGLLLLWLSDDRR